jgi:hypothetical protein
MDFFMRFVNLIPVSLQEDLSSVGRCHMCSESCWQTYGMVSLFSYLKVYHFWPVFIFVSLFRGFQSMQLAED